jgi:hypothetical protein
LTGYICIPATIPNKGNQGLARTSPGKECPASSTNVWETQPEKGVIYNINLACTKVNKTIILITTVKDMKKIFQFKKIPFLAFSLV